MKTFFAILLNILLFTVAVTVTPAIVSAKPIVIPDGLSDTAFIRSFDNALRDLEKNQDIVWDDTFDTPNASQLFEYLNRFSSVSVSDTSFISGNTRIDTELMSRPDVPMSLYIVETFNAGLLINYEKKVTN